MKQRFEFRTTHSVILIGFPGQAFLSAGSTALSIKLLVLDEGDPSKKALANVMSQGG
jgi:hypothetical protein